MYCGNHSPEANTGRADLGRAAPVSPTRPGLPAGCGAGSVLTSRGPALTRLCPRSQGHKSSFAALRGCVPTPFAELRGACPQTGALALPAPAPRGVYTWAWGAEVAAVLWLLPPRASDVRRGRCSETRPPPPPRGGGGWGLGGWGFCPLGPGRCGGDEALRRPPPPPV